MAAGKTRATVGPAASALRLGAAAALALMGLPGGGLSAAPTRLDTLHALVATNLDNYVEWFDRFFGDERLKDDNRRTRVTLGAGITFDAEDGVSLETEFSARLALPALERRLHLIVDDAFEADRANALVESLRESAPDAAARFILKDTDRLRFNADAGLRLGDPAQALLRVRARAVFRTGEWELRPSEVVRYYSHDGFSATTELRCTRILGDSWMFRSTTDLTWEEVSAGVTPAQAFMLFDEISPRRSQKLDISAAWPEWPHPARTVYALAFTYRQRIYRDWLYVETTPGVRFRQTERYEATPFLTILFEVVFGPGY